MDTFSTFHCGIVFSTVSKLVISMVTSCNYRKGLYQRFVLLDNLTELLVMPRLHGMLRSYLGTDKPQLNRFLNLSSTEMVLRPKQPRSTALAIAWKVSNHTLVS